MARKADGRGKVRAELEDVTLCMDAIDGSVALVRLRVEQAIRRAGLDGLLVPALEELVCIDAAVSEMRQAVQSALTRLLE